MRRPQSFEANFAAATRLSDLPALPVRSGESDQHTEFRHAPPRLPASAGSCSSCTGWHRAPANLADLAGLVTISVTADLPTGFDRAKVTNGVLELLREVDLIDQAPLRVHPGSLSSRFASGFPQKPPDPPTCQQAGHNFEAAALAISPP